MNFTSQQFDSGFNDAKNDVEGNWIPADCSIDSIIEHVQGSMACSVATGEAYLRGYRAALIQFYTAGVNAVRIP